MLGAKVRLVERPPERALLLLGYPSVFEAADHVVPILGSGCIGLEAVDGHLVENMERKGLLSRHLGLLPDGEGWLLVEFGGDTRDAAVEQAGALQRELGALADAPTSKLHDDPALMKNIWKVREAGLAATAFVPGRGDSWPGWEDAAVEPARLGAYLRAFRRLLDEHGLDASLYGHFDDGYIWDPDQMMNPGKVVRPYRLDENLRLGADHDPPPVDTVFSYPDDHHDFARAALRCVGVGECRRDDGTGTMCPSYMVTHEEKHSTRGRARLLFEMLNGGPELDGWRDRHVHEALELCLSCKACASECPVNVDMATYKAEFEHHYYRRRLRPVAAYSLGLIHHWSRLASRMPRPAPAYAAPTFREWFAERPVVNPDAPPVVLWPDTFTDRFEPHVGRAAVEVLERAGRRVRLPERWLCCGRPLYDFGMLTVARRQLRQVLDALGDDITAGTTVIGLEPSCVSIFRDELVDLFPRDAQASRLAQQFRTLTEFLVEIEARPPIVGGRAIVHDHCHHRSTLGTAADHELLDRMGLDWPDLDAGCCGLAGSFGFEAGEKVRGLGGGRRAQTAARRARRT